MEQLVYVLGNVCNLQLGKQFRFRLGLVTDLEILREKESTIFSTARTPSSLCADTEILINLLSTYICTFTIYIEYIIIGMLSLSIWRSQYFT